MDGIHSNRTIGSQYMNFTAEPTEIKILLLQAGKILSIIGRKIAGEKIGEEKSTIDWSLALSQYVTSGIEYIARHRV